MRVPTFLVLAHSDPDLLKRLLFRLRAVGNVVVHIDKKANLGDFEVEGVHYVEDRVDVGWAGYSMVTATLGLIRKALSLFPESSHFVLLSGACYPIVDSKSLAAFFNNNRDFNIIKLYDLRLSPDHFWGHLKEYHLRDYVGGRGGSILGRMIRVLLEGMLRITKPCWPSGMLFFAGSQWWALRPGCCAKIIKEVDSNSSYQSRYWRWVFAPDEIFFHTIVANIREEAELARISNSPFQCDNAEMHIIDQSLDRVFTIKDLEVVRNGVLDGKVFIRKVSSANSKELLDYLDLKSEISV